MREAQLSTGTIEYSDTGGDGPVLVLLTSVTMGPSLWDQVVDALGGRYRCLVVSLPLGAHRIPMRPDADLSMLGHARIVSDLLDVLDLRDVTLVQTDYAGGIAVVVCHPQRIARFVTTSCAAFENYPPGLPGRLLSLLARSPRLLGAAMAGMRLRWVRRLPLTFGALSKRPVPDAMFRDWFGPLWTDRAVRRDLITYVRSVDRDGFAALCRRLSEFDRPALVAWGADDRLMPIEGGRRLAATLPRARFVEIPDSGTLSSLDNPSALAREIAAFVPAGSTTSAHSPQVPDDDVAARTSAPVRPR